jgi:hypothetical protein
MELYCMAYLFLKRMFKDIVARVGKPPSCFLESRLNLKCGLQLATNRSRLHAAEKSTEITSYCKILTKERRFLPDLKVWVSAPSVG